MKKPRLIFRDLSNVAIGGAIAFFIAAAVVTPTGSPLAQTFFWLAGISSAVVVVVDVAHRSFEK
jgi:hypothetical protein